MILLTDEAKIMPICISIPYTLHQLESIHPALVLLQAGGGSFIGERAKRERHYQGCTNSSWCGICVYIYMYGGTYAIIVAHATHT